MMDDKQVETKVVLQITSSAPAKKSRQKWHIQALCAISNFKLYIKFIKSVKPLRLLFHMIVETSSLQPEGELLPQAAKTQTFWRQYMHKSTRQIKQGLQKQVQVALWHLLTMKWKQSMKKR